MHNISNAVIQPDSSRIINSGGVKTPREVGNSIFRNLLKKLRDESSPGDDLIGFQDIHSEQSSVGTPEGKRAESHAEKFLQAMEKLGLSRGRLKLKTSSRPALVSFLQQKGIGQEKIEQLLESLQDENGYINLDGLLSRIFPASGKQNEDLVIKSADVPWLEQFLFQCGLTVEEVKALVEKSVNPKGELSLARLSSQLSQYLSGDNSESRLLQALSRLDIQPRAAEPDPKLIESDWAGLLKQIPETSSTQIQKRIKQELAALLADKGIPQEEIKSFLETLSFKEVKTKPSLLSSESSARLLDGVVIASGQDWQSSPWKEQILKILQADQYQPGTMDFKVATGDQEIQLSLSELFKGDENSFKNALFEYLSQGKSLPGREELGQAVKDIMEKTRAQAKDGEPLGLAINLKKPEPDIGPDRAAPVSQDRNPSSPLPRIMDRMIFMIRGGIQRSRLMIHPPELGRLDLDLSIRHGHLQAHLSAESPMVKELIEANLNHLKQQLADQGLVVDKFEVMLGLNDQDSAENRNGMMEGKRPAHSSRGQRVSSVSASGDKEKEDNLLTGFYQVDVRA